MKRIRPVLSIGLAVTLVALSSLREASAQPSTSVDAGAYRGYLAVRRLVGGEVEVVDALPMNASGKVLKFELRERAAADG